MSCGEVGGQSSARKLPTFVEIRLEPLVVWRRRLRPGSCASRISADHDVGHRLLGAIQETQPIAQVDEVAGGALV